MAEESPVRSVLVTDYAWDSLDVEREILAPAGVEVIAAVTGEEDELIDLAPAADAIATCWKRVSAKVLDRAERCLVVARYGVGLDNIDVARAGELGMLVTNVPSFCEDEVAEHALALILALTRNVVRFAGQTSAGGWDNAAFGSMRRLRGQVLGIVGFGALGRALAGRAAALGLRVVVYSRSACDGGPDGVARAATLEELLAQADVVSLHVPLTDATRGMIGARELALMKPGALLINTSRGAVVDADALADAVAAGHLGGAGLDVMASEPPPAHPLLSLERVVVTPHAAFFSAESTLALQRGAAGSVLDVFAGRLPEHVVNPQVLSSPGLRATELGVPASAERERVRAGSQHGPYN
jgi:D-3-phosphoglycerate dehydrogenase